MGPSPPRRNRWLRVVVASALTLVASELGLRALDLPHAGGGRFRFVSRALEQDSFEPDATLFWRLKPAADVNRYHLRGYQPSTSKAEHDFRVACVGDSITYGLNEPLANVYGMQLERLLQDLAPAARVETVLAGLPGYTTYQSCILFAQSMLEYAPDLTVLTCGAWNDFMPAIDDADEKLTGPSEPPRLRLIAAISQAWRIVRRRSDEAMLDTNAMLKQTQMQSPPQGRRVPLDAFARNLTNLIAMARRSGDVVIVIPALHEEAERAVPIAREYRREVERVARAHSVRVVDALREVREYEAALPRVAKCNQPSVCLQDWVHLTATGHALVARKILASTQGALPERFQAMMNLPTDDTLLPYVTAVRPSTIEALKASTVTLEGTGFCRRTPIDRIWVGGELVRSLRVIDDQHLEISAPPLLPPGRHAIDLITARGCRHAAAQLEIKPVALVASITRQGESAYQLLLAGHASPHRRIVVWLSLDGLAREATATQFGPLWLPLGDELHAAARREVPLCFEALPHYSVTAYTGEANTWRAEISGTLPGPHVREMVVQGVVYLQNSRVGAVTEPVRLKVVR